MIDDEILEDEGIDPESATGLAPTAEETSDAIEPIVDETSLCLSCGGETFGMFCVTCGQKNDDMRRSSVILVRDFFQDTFGFDSRMWRTLGLLAIAPGAVASNYAIGKRSRYTPPVRLFLVVSFLFFLVLSLSNTMIVAMAVKPADAVERTEEVNADTVEEAASETSAKMGIVFSTQFDDDVDPVSITEGDLDCELTVSTRFFVRPNDLQDFGDLWERCAGSIEDGIANGIAQNNRDSEEVSQEDLKNQQEALGFVHKAIAGTTSVIENPASFNRAMNAWLPRLMFLMTPILALILALFIRGRDALLFDHVVFGLYLHAAMFAIVGISVLLGQIGIPQMGLIASLLIATYYIVGLKRAYSRGWVKTIWTSLASSFLYIFVLAFALTGILTNILWTSV